MIPLKGFKVERLVHQSKNSIIYRGLRLKGKKPVVIKMLSAEHPSVEELIKFRREYEMLKNLDTPFVIKAYQLEKLAGLPVFIMEDGGESLDKFLNDNPLEINDFFDIAKQVTQALAEVHHYCIIHKDINPSNILWNSETKQAKLIDFGIATELSRESVSVSNPSGLEGTLTYISPEQTGRMNRAIDYRTDLYSLGATFYRILTGRDCFHSSDPIELVHSHIAMKPTPPHQVNPKVPRILSDIVLKLMEKLVEDRYQSASGVLKDLEHCQKLFDSGEGHQGFELAQQDYTAGLSIPQKLYGREQEAIALLDCFERVASGYREILMVRGYSGIGKSSLIHEIQVPIVKKKGVFIEGKFDQFKRNIPYASIIQAFQELVKQLLASTKEEVEHWRQRLVTALGPNGQVIVEVIPELELLIGKQPDIPELTSSEANNRFQLTFKNFVKTFASETSPLVLFLDDLQWADMPSLKLIENVLGTESDRHILIIGAYRDNEVDLVHPLVNTLKRLEEIGVSVRTLELKPLQISHVNELIADTFHVEGKQQQQLAQLCIEKTQGNPFFLNQFLRSLYDQNAIYFDIDAATWKWNVQKLRKMQTTENVVDLMIQRLESLDSEAQSILKTAACIGASFSLRFLSIATELSPEKVSKALWPALKLGLILPLNDAYKFVEAEAGERITTQGYFAETTGFRFLHDRVQQAAYSLIEVNQLPKFHLRTGRLLLSNSTEKQQDDQIFDIVNHLNIGKALITNESEQLQLAKLNYSAAEKALASSAYGPANAFATTALALLSEKYWEQMYSDCFDMHLTALKAACLTASFERMEELAAALLKQAQTNLDRVKVNEVKIQAAMAVNQPLQAIDIALDILNMLGQSFPIDITPEVVEAELKAAVAEVANFEVDELLDLPEMSHPNDIAAMEIMNRIYSATYIAKPELMVLVSCRLALLSITKGSMPLSSFAYSSFGLVLCGLVGDIERGHQFGELAIKVYEKYHLTQHKCRTYFMVYHFVWHWKRHLKDTHKPLLESYQSGLDSGELEFAGYAACIYTDYCFFAGKQLDELSTESRQYIAAIDRIQQQTPLYYAQIVAQTVDNLRDRNLSNPCLLKGDNYDEDKMYPQHVEANDQTAIAFLFIHKLILNYLLGNTDEALKLSEKVEPYVGAITAMFHTPIYYFYSGLAVCAAWPQLDKKERGHWEAKLKQYQQSLRNWSSYSEVNHKHKYLLIEAEWNRIQGLESEARIAYKAAIQLAQKNDYIQEEAMAYELSAKFWYGIDENEFGLLNMRHAHHRFKLWGAKRKVAAMERQWPVLAIQPNSKYQTTVNYTQNNTTSTAIDGRQALDTLSIIKASQAISSEIVFEELIKSLLRYLIENAGAEKGVLFFSSDGESFTPVSAAKLDQGKLKFFDCSQPYEDRLHPVSIINYTRNSNNPVLLDNAMENTNYRHDRYVMENKCKSILCYPIEYQGKLVAILYLENNLLTGVFNSKRLETIKMLSAQAAISLINANNYATLEQEVALRTQEIRQKNEELQLATNAKSEFLAKMSHEIRTPMNAVIGLSRLALKTRLDPQQKDYIEKVLDAGEALLNLINDILDFSKIEAGKLNIEATSFQLEKIVNRAVSLSAMNAHVKGLELITDFSKDIPKSVVGDPLRLQQIVVNLVNNAVKFTNRGSICIKVRRDKETADSITLLFSVIDTGIGMEQQQSEKLFQSFSQADDSVTRKYGGTGLGLAISKQLCELMGGEIWVVSELNKGSVFNFTVTLEKSSEDLRHVQENKLSHLKALVVDDNEMARTVLVDLLSRLEIEVAEANSGYQAISLVNEAHEHDSPFDILLMDWRMPNMDGIEASCRILEQKLTHAPHIFMVSAYDKDEAKKSAKKRGFEIEKFIEKPVGLAQLSDAIASLYSGEISSPVLNEPDEYLAPNLSRSKILLVEDNAINRQVALGFLSDTQAQVDIAENGEIAIDKIKKQKYDAVLMDIQMPEMDGHTATKIIRTELKMHELPIIAMTAEALHTDIDRSKLAGLNAHITKPVDPMILFNTLERFILPNKKQKRLNKVNDADKNDSIIEQLGEIKSLNVTQAIKKLGGKQSLYLNLVNDFQKSHWESPDLLRKMGDSNQLQQLFRALHSLKSMAAYIGAYELSELCASLESKTEHGEYDDSLLKSICVHLTDIFDELSVVFSEDDESHYESDFSEEKLKNILTELIPLLKASSFDADNYLDQLQQLCEGTEYAEQSKTIFQYVEDFEHPRAAAIAQDLLQKL